MTITIQVCMLNCHSCVQLCVGLWIVACHLLHPWYSLGKILEWVAMPHSPGDLPDPGIELMSLMSPALAGRFFTTSTMWEAHNSSLEHSKLCKRNPISIVHHFPIPPRRQLLIYLLFLWICLFWILNINGIIEHVILCDCLSSLSIIFLSFIHFVVRINTSFLFSAK